MRLLLSSKDKQSRRLRATTTATPPSPGQTKQPEPQPDAPVTPPLQLIPDPTDSLPFTPPPNIQRHRLGSSSSLASGASSPLTPLAQIMNPIGAPSEQKVWSGGDEDDDGGDSSVCSSGTGLSERAWTREDDKLIMQVYSAVLSNPTEAPFAGKVPPSGLASRVARRVARQCPKDRGVKEIRKRLLFLCTREYEIVYSERGPDENSAKTAGSLRRPFRDSGYGESDTEPTGAPVTPIPTRYGQAHVKYFEKDQEEDADSGFSFIPDNGLQHLGVEPHLYESAYPTPTSPSALQQQLLEQQQLQPASVPSPQYGDSPDRRVGIALSTPIHRMSNFTRQSNLEYGPPLSRPFPSAPLHAPTIPNNHSFEAAQGPGGLGSPFKETVLSFPLAPPPLPPHRVKRTLSSLSTSPCTTSTSLHDTNDDDFNYITAGPPSLLDRDSTGNGNNDYTHAQSNSAWPCEPDTMKRRLG